MSQQWFVFKRPSGNVCSVHSPEAASLGAVPHRGPFATREEATQAHEDVPGNPPLAKQMDLFNNEVGRGIPVADKSETEALKVKERVDAGTMRRIVASQLVPSNGAGSAIDGIWESTEPDKRFRLEISRDSVKLTERGTQNTTPGATFERTSKMLLGEKFRIYRDNDMATLTFLNFQPKSLRDAIIAQGPQPSYLALLPTGKQIAGEFSGLMITKKPDGSLNQVIQPGTKPPKPYPFVRIG